MRTKGLSPQITMPISVHPKGRILEKKHKPKPAQNMPRFRQSRLAGFPKTARSTDQSPIIATGVTFEISPVRACQY